MHKERITQIISNITQSIPQSSVEVFVEIFESSMLIKENGTFNTPSITAYEGIRVVIQKDKKRHEIAQAGLNSKALYAEIEEIVGEKITTQELKEIPYKLASKAKFQADGQHIAKLQHLIEGSESYLQEHATVLSYMCAAGYAIDNYFAYNSTDNLLIEEQLPRLKCIVNATIENNDKQPSTVFRSLAGTDCMAELQETYLTYLGEDVVAAKRPFKQLEEGAVRDIVIDGKSKAGVLFHEAVGHPFEQDICKHGPFETQWTDLSFHPSVNVVDNPLLEGAYGSYSFDHEATPAQKTHLIKDGKPTATMKSRFTSQGESTGHGRRETFLNESLVRMSNTYLDAGSDKSEDIIASVKDGIYITAVGGGQVNIVTGEFMFVATDAYMIKGGVVQEQRYSNITLKGSAVEVLQNITMVADDLDFSVQNLIANSGTCGKGQSMRVGLASPTFKTRMYVA